VEFFHFWQIGFLSQKFGSSYASKPIKGSLEADYKVVPKKNLAARAKKWPLGWAMDR